MPSEPERILVYRMGNLGDTVVALPAFEAVRRRFPQARMTLMSEKSPGSPLVASTEVLPARLFDDYISYPASATGTDPRRLLALLPRLRKSGFDLLVYLAPRRRSRWPVCRDQLFFRMAGIRRAIGFAGRTGLRPRRPGEPLPSLEHEADYLLGLVARGGIPVPASGERSINLDLDASELSFARDYLRSRAVPLDGLPVAFAPGSKAESKRWPEAHFAETGARLIRAYGAFPVVFGGAEDVSLGDRLVAAWGRGINAAGRLSIRESAAALSCCRLLVGNDSGPAHLAAAVGVRCVGIYAAIDYPGRWHPYGRQHIVIRHDLECSGCMQTRCPRAGQCIQSISVEEVCAGCDRLLREIGRTANLSAHALRICGS